MERLTHNEQTLLLENRSLIWGYLRNKVSRGVLRVLGEETIYDGLLDGLLACCKTYDPDKGKFSSYAYKSFDNRMICLLKRFNGIKSSTVGDKAHHVSDIPTGSSIKAEVDLKMLKQCIRNAIGNSDQEELLYDRYLNIPGNKLDDLARKHNLTFEVVRKGLRDSLETIKAYMEREELTLNDFKVYR